MERRDHKALLRESLLNGLKSSWDLGLFLLKVVLPIFVLTEVLQASGVLSQVSRWFGPAMAILGLPPEAAVSLTVGMTVSMYGGVAVAAPLGLTSAQMTVVGVMLGISHDFLLESAVVRKFTPHYRYLFFLRFFMGLLAGLVTAWIV